MSLFKLFKKETNCQSCGEVLPLKNLYGFDSSFRGESSTGKKLVLCRECFLSKMASSIREFKQKALFYYPTKQNAYHFYKFDATLEEKKLYGYSEDFPYKHKSQLPSQGQKCHHCDNIAQFTLCYGDGIDIATYNLEKIEIDDIEFELVCNDCLISKITEAMREQNIIWKEFFPPVDTDGICISGEC